MSLSRNNKGRPNLRTASSSTIGKWEDIIFQLVLLGPVFGLLYPPELYMVPESAATLTVSVARQSLNFPFTTLVTHLVTLFMVFLIFRHWRQYLGNLKYATLLLLEFAVFVSSATWSPEPYISLRTAFHLSLFIILAIHVVYRYTAPEFIGLITRLSTLAGVLCLFSIVLIPSYSHSIGLEGYNHAWRGLYGTKNYLGTMCDIAIACSGYSFLINANSRRTIYICFSVNLLLLVLSDSATSVVTGFVAFLFIAVAYLLRTSLGRILLVLGVIVAALLVSAIMLGSSGGLFALLGRSSDFTGRAGIWTAVTQLIEAKPDIGYGLGFWSFDTLEKNNAWAEIGFAAPHSHNDVLDVLLQTGIFGFSFYALNILGTMALSIWRIGKLRDGSLLCLIFTVGFIINGLTEALTLSDDPRFTFILFCFQIYVWKAAFSRQKASALSPSSVHLQRQLVSAH